MPQKRNTKKETWNSRAIFWVNTRMWDVPGEQWWRHELKGIKRPSSANGLTRGDSEPDRYPWHLWLEKPKKEILFGCCQMHPCCARLQQLPPGRGEHTTSKQCGFVTIPVFCSLAAYYFSPQAIWFWYVINLSAKPLFICIHQDLKLWCLFPPLCGRREIRCEDFPVISFLFLFNKSIWCSCTTVIWSLGRRGRTADSLSPSMNHIQELTQSDGPWKSHRFQRSHGIWCRDTLASSMRHA